MPNYFDAKPDIRPIGASGTFLTALPGNGKGFTWSNPGFPTGISSLSNVSITSAASGQIFGWNGISWVNFTPNDVSGYTLIKNSGISLSPQAILNFISTGFLVSNDSPNNQTIIQLAPNLEGISRLSSHGFFIKNGPDFFTPRTFASGSTKVSIQNPDGISGNPTFDIVENQINLSNVAGTLPISKGGTALTNISFANALLGANNAGNGLEYKNLYAGDTSISVDHSLEEIIIYVNPAFIYLGDFSGILPVSKGGTGRNSVGTGTILIGNGTSELVQSSLSYDNTNRRLMIGGSGAPNAGLEIRTDTNPIFSFVLGSLAKSGLKDTVDYDGSSLYLNDSFGLNYRIATTGNNITDFVGTLPLTRGGTGATVFASGTLITSNGTKFTPLTGIGTNEIPTWNGSIWTSSSGSYITMSPSTFGRNVITAQNTSVQPLSIVGASGQATGFFTIYDHTARSLLDYDKDGHLYNIGQITTSGALTVYGLIGAQKAGGAIVLNSGSHTLPSIYTLNQALQGINFHPQSGIQIRCLVGWPVAIFNDTSGARFNYGFSVGSGSKYSIFDVDGNGNKLVFPSGNGTLALVSQLSSSASGIPGGNNTQIQINQSGIFGGSSKLTFDYTSGFLSVNNFDPLDNSKAVLGINNSGNNEYGFIITGSGGHYHGYMANLEGHPSIGFGDIDTVRNKTSIYLDDLTKNISLWNPSGKIHLGNALDNSRAIRIMAASGATYYGLDQFVWNSGSLSKTLKFGPSGSDIDIFLPATGGTLALTSQLTSGGSEPTVNQRTRSIVGGFQGNPIVSGMISTPCYISNTGTIINITMLADQTGSIVVDIRKSVYDNYPVATSICSTTIPTITDGVKYQDTTLTAWITELNTNDILTFVVTSGNNLITNMSVNLMVLGT